jgi:hypothetical protein
LVPLALLRWRIDVMTLGDDWHTWARPIGSEELATSMRKVSPAIREAGYPEPRT